MRFQVLQEGSHYRGFFWLQAWGFLGVVGGLNMPVRVLLHKETYEALFTGGFLIEGALIPYRDRPRYLDENSLSIVEVLGGKVPN